MWKFFKSLVPPAIIKLVVPLLLKRRARRLGLSIKPNSESIDVVKGSDVIRLSSHHAVYLKDIIDAFQYYFSSVVPYKSYGNNIVDYSTPRYHGVIGFDFYPIFFQSFSEPLITTTQYMDFANLSEGMTALDFGAYSGLSSIMFSMAVGKTGTVIAVDADPQNIDCIKINFSNFRKYSNGRLFLLEGAVWKNNDGLAFSCEGNMGSSAASIAGNNRGMLRKVPSFTLSAIVDKFKLERVDFIKCDIEGAEVVVFSDQDFFRRFLPKIIIEAHKIDGLETAEKCIATLQSYGYTCKRVAQEGSSMPLLECLPPAASFVK